MAVRGADRLPLETDQPGKMLDQLCLSLVSLLGLGHGPIACCSHMGVSRKHGPYNTDPKIAGHLLERHPPKGPSIYEKIAI